MLGTRVLIVDDDESLVGAVSRWLVAEDYYVIAASNGVAALSLARERSPDLVILDIVLPGMTGYEVCRHLRTFSSSSVLMLTARDTVLDKVAGLDSGADDYLVKPFAVDELLARLRALQRSRLQPGGDGAVVVFAGLRLDPALRQVWCGMQEVNLRAREFDLLEFFMRHPRVVHSRERIFERVWQQPHPSGSNVVDFQIRALRSKLEALGAPRVIHTYRRVGYALHHV